MSITHLTKKEIVSTAITALFIVLFLISPKTQLIKDSNTELIHKNIEMQYPANFSDDKVLVGASHNIFVGKVIAESGRKERKIGPETQYRVEVLANIKGNLKGEVIVNQFGGIRDGVLYTADFEENIPEVRSYLLQSGGIYLFTTRYNEKENWYTLNTFPTANRFLAMDDGQRVEEIQAMIDNDLRVLALRKAYPNEILIDADVKSSKTYNSYKSLDSSTENAALKAE